MDYDYSRRGCLLPEGCKDLVDVLNLQKAASRTPTTPEFKILITDKSWVAMAQMPGLRSEDIVISVEGSALRISGKEPPGGGGFEVVIRVPAGYDIARALAIYAKGELCIVAPKA